MSMRLFVHQLRSEQLLFWRSKEAALFIFLFPLLLFTLLGSVYNGKIYGVPAAQVLLAGLIGYGRANTSFPGPAVKGPGALGYTPGRCEALMGLQSMVTRKGYKGRVWGPNQKVTIDQALTIATINGAYASSEEHLKGSITAGKLADFVVLENDPHDVDPDQIMHIKVNRTVVGGKTVYGG